MKDKFGLSRQIVPVTFAEMMRDGDARRVDRVMRAMLRMVRLDIAALRMAYDAG